MIEQDARKVKRAAYGLFIGYRHLGISSRDYDD
jgi:hypothetical protein